MFTYLYRQILFCSFEIIGMNLNKFNLTIKKVEEELWKLDEVSSNNKYKCLNIFSKNVKFYKSVGSYS
jgi:hypothetical protein